MGVLRRRGPYAVRPRSGHDDPASLRLREHSDSTNWDPHPERSRNEHVRCERAANQRTSAAFGSRAYELSVDERDFVLRYAACFQQFSMVKDWTLSYRNLPFGTLEVADSYRMEQSGELLLSFRLRKFLMPDLHIYLTNLKQSIDVGKEVHEIIYEEIRKLHREYVSIYNTTRSFFKEHKELFLDLVKVEKKP